MNNVVHSYQHDGRKAYTIYLPASILAMQRLEMTGARQVKCLLVALSNGRCWGCREGPRSEGVHND